MYRIKLDKKTKSKKDKWEIKYLLIYIMKFLQKALKVERQLGQKIFGHVYDEIFAKGFLSVERKVGVNIHIYKIKEMLQIFKTHLIM